MKKYTLFLLPVFLATLANGQIKESAWTETVTAKEGYSLYGLYRGENRVYALHGSPAKNPRKFYLERFDENMKPVASAEYTLPDEKTEFLGAGEFKSAFRIITEVVSGNKHKVMSHIASEGELTDPKTLAVIDFDDAENAGAFKISYSPSGEFFCILGELPVVDGKNERIHISSYDRDLNPVIDLELALDVEYKRNIHNYIFCTNTGNAFLVKKDREKNTYRHLVYAVTPNSTSMVSKTVSVGNKHITDIRARVNESGQLLVGGFYSSQPFHEYAGYFMYAYDAGLAQVYHSYALLDSYTISLHASKNTKDNLLHGYYISEIVTTSDGSSYIISEERGMTKENDKIYTQQDKLMLLAFDKDGHFINSFSVKKSQENPSDDTRFMSYVAWPQHDSLMLAYTNKTAAVKSKKQKKDNSTPGDYQSFIYRITATGGASNRAFTAEDDAFNFDATSVVPAGDGKVLVRFCNADYSQYKLGVLRLE